MTITEDIRPEISGHPAHPMHKLKLVTDDGRPFTCDGCMEPGVGTRYRCEHDSCNFDLHAWCADAPDILKHHLFGDRAFVFLHEPPAPAGRRVCDACGEDVRGFVYHCFEGGGGLDLHPCCARLPERIALQGHGGGFFELCKEASSRCGRCGGKAGKFWFYRSDCDDGEAVYLHVACVMDMASRSWKAACRGGNRGHIMQAISAPVLDGVLQKRPAKRRTAFQRWFKFVGAVVRVIIGVIFGDPTAMIAAVAGIVFSNG